MATFPAPPEEVRLSITNKEEGFTVSWPAAAANWVLEESATLPPAWARVGAERYASVGTSRVAQVSAGGGGRFFRLREARLVAPGLTGFWGFDEGAGNVAGDGSGTGAALALSGVSWVTGRVGSGAGRFNGAAAGSGGSRASVGNEGYRVLPAAGQPFSVSLWLNPEAVTLGWRGLIGTDGNGSNGWHVALHSPGPGTNYLIFAGTGVGSSLSVTGRTLLLPDQWRQLVVTYDGTVGSVYLDCELLAQGTGLVAAHEGALFLGGGVAGLDSWLGRLDEAKTYARCLSWDEVALAGAWGFDEGGGVFVADGSGQGRHGSMSSGAWAMGRNGMGVHLGQGTVALGNADFGVLPVTGRGFSASFWLRPAWSEGRGGLMRCGAVGSKGWELDAVVESMGAATLHWSATNRGGTLNLHAPVGLTNGVWTKVELTFNGGVATMYADGRKVKSDIGAIRGGTGALLLGTGATNFGAALDELKIYHRERGEGEVGPVAAVMWETVLRNTATNLALQGAGPAGRTLTYAIVPVILPTNGTVALGADGISFTYTAGSRKGPDAFTYTVSDGEFTSPPTIVAMSVVEPHWLSPTGGAEPRDGSNPAQAWAAGTADALDAIWKTNNYYDCFFYTPGVFETRGWRYGERSTANTGCKHVGSGKEGTEKTTVRLVDIWSTWIEETIFSPLNPGLIADGFEVHQMVLDCNAENLPKYTRGEPVWMRVPLATTGMVDTVTLRWAERNILGHGWWRAGRAMEFRLCALRNGTNVFATNCAVLTSTGQVDIVSVGVPADEVVLYLDRRATGVDFYGLAGVEVSGGTVSLPAATVPGGGESRLDAAHSILSAVDGSFGTSWASGTGAIAQIVLPVLSGTTMSGVQLHWNCQTLAGVGRLGSASAFVIQARNELSGLLENVPYVTTPPTAAGLETVRFGGVGSPISIVTDQLVLVLGVREAGVDFYSLREVVPLNGDWPIPVRVPTAMNSLDWGGFHRALDAFDLDPVTQWASATQGMVGAMNVPGNNLKFTRLKIVGFGTKAVRECFPVAIIPPPGSPPVMGNVLVDQCDFSDPANWNPDGLSTVSLAGTVQTPLTNAMVRRCTFIGLGSHFAYSHAVGATHVENCLVDGCGEAFYLEPQTVGVDFIGPVLIRSNSFINVTDGIRVSPHPGTRFDSMICIGNEIVLRGPAGYGFASCDTCRSVAAGPATNIAFLNNVIRYTDWVSRPQFPDGGIYISDIEHAVFGNNLITLGTVRSLRIRDCPSGVIYGEVQREDCHHPGIPPSPTAIAPPCLDVPPSGYRRAWFRNRDLTGGMLPVFFRNNGLDGPATQQQWSD